MEGDAAARAFAVPELLESILLRLPASDLLRSQGVSKHFSGVFKSSIKIQRTLCFVADPVIEIVVVVPISGGGSLKAVGITYLGAK